MRTEYESHQASFSEIAHEAAKVHLYPSLFGTPDIEFERFDVEDEDFGSVFDGRLGIDIVARPNRENAPGYEDRNPLRSRLHFYVQERFRRASYAHFGDVTITEFNHASGTPSELYKIAAGLMMYGVYDEDAEFFVCAYAIDVARTLLAIQRRKLSFSRNQNRKGQDFVCLAIADLRKTGCILWSHPKDNGCR